MTTPLPTAGDAGNVARGNTGTIVNGTSGQPTSVQLQLQLKLYQAQLKSTQASLKSLQAQAAKLKGKTDKASKASLAGLNARIKLVQGSLNAVNNKVNDTQNKYYETTGQYDKLLSGTNRDAYLALDTLFKNYGLDSLAGKIYDYVKNGYSSDTISILLQDTPEYKARFAANDARVKAGLPVLSPADYINTENSYRQILRQSGLPEGFYDSTDDFTDWLSKDVSPTEVQSRVDLATQATALANPAYKQALNQMGIDDGHMAAYFLDPDKSLPLLQKAAATAAVGAAALGQGLTFDQSYAEQLATTGVTAAQAQQGYSQVAAELGTMQNLASAYGSSWSQRQSEESVFGTNATDAAQKAALIGQEKGAFSAQSGTAKAGLSQTRTQTSG